MAVLEHPYSKGNRFIIPYSGMLSDKILSADLALACTTPGSVEECVAELNLALEKFLVRGVCELPPVNSYCMLKDAVTGNCAVGYCISLPPSYKWKGEGITTVTPDISESSSESALMSKYALGKQKVQKG